MIRIFGKQGAPLDWENADDAIWFDLYEPTLEEERQLEALLGRDVPTPAERAAIEDSARNYSEDRTVYFTPNLLGRRDEGAFVVGPVNFMLFGKQLVTVRNVNPRAFEIGKGRASARITEAHVGQDIAIALIEGASERIADLLSEQSAEAYELAERILEHDVGQNLKAALKSIGRVGAIAGLCQSSLSSLQRSIIFLAGDSLAVDLSNSRLLVLRHDIEELERLSEGLQGRMAFLQELTLGLISEKQTDVLKALSLAAIGFIPATLVASIFGMNFEFMSWYGAAWGPYLAFLLMLIAPALLFGIARWLRLF